MSSTSANTPALSETWHSLAGELSIGESAKEILNTTLDRLSTHHPPTANHSMRVGILAVRVGEVVGNLPTKLLYYGGSLHDCGKLQVPATLLDKKEAWTSLDAAALRNHPIDGYEMIMRKGMAVAAGIVVRHHTFQPNGYPKILPSWPSQIPKHIATVVHSCARVVALADFYDAAHRANSDGVPSGSAIEEKVRAHNGDVVELVDTLYSKGIFTPHDIDRI